MPRLFTDNAITTLATGITAVETEMTVAAGQGSNFPVVDGTDTNYIVITMEDAAGNIEFIRVDHRVGDVMGSVTYPNTRAYDSGPAAQAWIAGDAVDVRWTAGSMNSLFLPTQDMIPETTNLYDIGSNLFRFKDQYMEGDYITNGLVDGRLVAVDGAKLDTITWTGAAIKALYELEPNAFTDIKNAVLNSIFHIGFQMFSSVATNPSALGYPGVWTQIGLGQTLIGEGAGRVAGASIGQTDSIVPQHNHSTTDPTHTHGTTNTDHNHGVSDPGHFHHTTAQQNLGGYTDNGGAPDQRSAAASIQSNTKVTGISIQNAEIGPLNNASTGVSVDNEGVSPTDGNMQPSLVTYIWERTS
jgi:hypothetical protein